MFYKAIRQETPAFFSSFCKRKTCRTLIFVLTHFAQVENRYESHYRVSHWGPTRKPRCPQRPCRTCLKSDPSPVSPHACHRLASPNSGESKLWGPVAQGRSQDDPRRFLPHLLRLTPLLTSASRLRSCSLLSSCLHFQGPLYNNVLFPCPRSCPLLAEWSPCRCGCPTPLLTAPHLPVCTCTRAFKSKHLERRRACVRTPVCRVCDGQIDLLSVFPVRD